LECIGQLENFRFDARLEMKVRFDCNRQVQKCHRVVGKLRPFGVQEEKARLIVVQQAIHELSEFVFSFVSYYG